MGRQTRSKGTAEDPKVGGTNELWRKPQPGVFGLKVKAIELPAGPSYGFVTLKLPLQKYRALSCLEGVSRPGNSFPAGAFVSFQTPSEKKEDEVQEKAGSIAASVVDLKTPVAGPAFTGTVAARASCPKRSEAHPAGLQSPERPSISPITSPDSESDNLLTQTSEGFAGASVGLGSRSELDESLANGVPESRNRTNERRTQAGSVTSIQESQDFPRTIASASSLSFERKEPCYNLQPSPKTRAQNPVPQAPAPVSVSGPDQLTSTAATPTDLHLPSVSLNTTLHSTLSLLGEYRFHEAHRVVPPHSRPTGLQHVLTVSHHQHRPDSFASPLAESVTEEHISSFRNQSSPRRHRSIPPTSQEQKTSTKRKAGRPRKSQVTAQSVQQLEEQPRLKLVVKLPIKQGYILNSDMAPVRDPQDVSGSMKEIIQNMFDATQTVVGFVPESQELLIDRMAELTQNLAHLQSITNPDTAPNNPVHNIRIAPEIVDYVDDGRNPDIFTRDFVELAQRGNAVMNGKKKAFNSFAEIYARELKKGIRGIDKHVDAVMTNAGMDLVDEKQSDDKAKENGEHRS